MSEYIIATDNTADLPESYLKENGIGWTIYIRMELLQSMGKFSPWQAADQRRSNEAWNRHQFCDLKL